jgi:hypothetical protein
MMILGGKHAFFQDTWTQYGIEYGPVAADIPVAY